MSMNYLEFNEYLNKNKYEGQSKVDVIAWYTHYYLLKWGFGLLNEKEEVVDQSIMVNKGMDGDFVARYAINELKMTVTLLNSAEFVTFVLHPDDQVEPARFRIKISYVNEENKFSDENFKTLQKKFDEKMFSLNGNIILELNKIKSSISKSLVGDLLVSSSDKDKDNNSGTTV